MGGRRSRGDGGGDECDVERALINVWLGHGEYVGGQRLMGRNVVCACIQHALGKAFGFEAGGLEVLDHGPGAPAAHESGMKGIHAGANKGHAATIAKGASRDIFTAQAVLVADCFAGGTKSGVDVVGCDGKELSIGIVGVQGRLRGGLVLSKVSNLSLYGFQRGQQRMGCVAMTNGLTFDSVLLLGEFEKAVGGGCNFIDCNGGGIVVALAMVQGGVH